jgi:hypothetical protein
MSGVARSQVVTLFQWEGVIGPYLEAAVGLLGKWAEAVVKNEDVETAAAAEPRFEQSISGGIPGLIPEAVDGRACGGLRSSICRWMRF